MKPSYAHDGSLTRGRHDADARIECGAIAAGAAQGQSTTFIILKSRAKTKASREGDSTHARGGLWTIRRIEAGWYSRGNTIPSHHSDVAITTNLPAIRTYRADTAIEGQFYTDAFAATRLVFILGMPQQSSAL
jgi:hypothetical protein